MRSIKKILKFINQHPLASRHKLKAYWRFFAWQAGQFISPHETDYPFAGNTKLLVKKGLAGATGNIYTGLHDFADMGFLLHFLRKNDLFFDIGSNVGSYTILAAGCCGANAVAFEPVPATYAWLKKNIEINKLDGLVKACQLGVSNGKGVLLFTRSYDAGNHIVLPAEKNMHGETIEVPVLDFDTIAMEEGVPDLIKIDVEGFETDVLSGMSLSLQSSNLKAIIIELNGSGVMYGFDEKLIHEKLCNHQFRPYRYEPFTRNLVQLESFGSNNTIYIRDLDFVKGRVATAGKIKIFSETF